MAEGCSKIKGCEALASAYTGVHTTNSIQRFADFKLICHQPPSDSEWQSRSAPSGSTQARAGPVPDTFTDFKLAAFKLLPHESRASGSSAARDRHVTRRACQ
eukprot:3429203-Rhodomonas_salina.2